MDLALDKNIRTAESWRNKGIFIPVFNKEIFTIDLGESEDCLVILHGYLTSSYDYNKVIDELSKKYRVIIPDLIGFGFSDKVFDYYFTSVDQADYILEFCKQLGLKNITFLGHDYGTAIVQEILARKNANVLGLQIKEFIYCNGNLPINHSNFLDTQDSLKSEVSKKIITMLASFGVYKKTMKEIFFDNANITDEELKQMWLQLEYNHGRKVINFIYNYLRERKIFWNRWSLAIKETTVPIRIIWGKKDLLVDEIIPLNLANKVQANNIHWINDAGHFPMLEKPKEFISAVLNG
ncbi:alpha/beta fold hydrolase [Polaribacter sp.]|uniref:alpha/beta fold hydrolase n=1 Tax=Polaribacter sp. TaxID=1920175 RepID=UPI003F69F492